MRLRAVRGDLAGFPADVVVRVVPPTRRRGPVDDELGLLRAAGPAAREALAELLELEHGGVLPPGCAVSTTGGGLAARWLVHMAVPAFRIHGGQEHLVARAYRAALAACDAIGARSVALPPVGMTLPYWPLDDAVRLAVSTLPNTTTRVVEGTLVVRTDAALGVLTAALTRS